MSKRNRILVMTGLLVIAIQLVPVRRDNPPVTAEIQTPDEIGSLLRGSCYDCHSNLTEWPWYSRVAPASWLVVKDVRKGRSELNFTEWGDYTDRRRDHKLEELEEKVSEGEMPLKIYLPLHPEARLTDAERQVLVDWARAERAAMGPIPEAGE
ncbi:MAG: heme-binding domain-containing protein [Candidatus Palauibacterales bacterium]|nr:heme-binding domain-containing protein [Candidatus Palauibacterales bacterium]MDP2482419.1 heme-binding domain-containing protein [Candidatus Palauibacterales bacterium]